MSRTLGFFLGSAVVFALLVIVLGQPVTLAPPTDRNNQSQAETAVSQAVQLPEATVRAITPVSLPAVKAPAQSSQSTQNLALEPKASASPATDVASTTAAAAKAVAQINDENSLAEQWMATAPTLPVDSTVENPVDNDEATLPFDNSADNLPVAAADNVDWFPVWDPFHSELSANAFARRLESVTGLDYRVIKTDTNQYRVAMAYSSEDQRMVNVAMIEEATGLSVSGGSR